jgi:polyhydroxyalkanoate synthesis repressor PhaR
MPNRLSCDASASHGRIQCIAKYRFAFEGDLMPNTPIQIKRYPNRRYYARNTSKYVSLKEIEEMIKAGETVEICDSQSGEDMTRSVLTQIILERQPDKMALFPSAMLHGILRSNDVMSDFLRDYFRQSVTYLDYLQRHSATTKTLTQPMHWIKAWLDGITPSPAENSDDSKQEGDSEPLSHRVEQLEERLRELENE